MGAKAQIRGHAITWDGKAWRYEDTGAPIPGYGGDERPCVVCGEISIDDDDRDPCLRGLPDSVMSACCGHGVQKGYIIWNHDQI